MDQVLEYAGLSNKRYVPGPGYCVIAILNLLSLFFTASGMVSMLHQSTIDAYTQLAALLLGFPFVAAQFGLGILIPILFFDRYRHQYASKWLWPLLTLGIAASASAVFLILTCLKLPATSGSGC